MPTLEEKIQGLESKPTGNKPAEGGNSSLMDEVYRIPSQINVGIAQLMGLPSAVEGLTRKAMGGTGEETTWPTTEEIQGKMADLGMTYEPGEEPDTVYDRFLQNLGASLIPAGGVAIKTGRAIAPVAQEVTASFGGAAGGKALQATEWGQENPTAARAIGELGGGISASSVSSLKKVAGTPSMIAYRWLKAPFRGEWAKGRAAKMYGESADNIDESLKNLERTRGGEFEGLTPSQRTGDRGLARQSRRVQEDVTGGREAGINQRSQAGQDLKQAGTQGEEGLPATRDYLERRFTEKMNEAEESLKNVGKAGDPVTHNRVVKQKLQEAHDLARRQEEQVWGNLPEAGDITPMSTKRVYQEEVDNITEGGDIGEISSFIRQKLGKNGELLNETKDTASPKALHQFYSRLGREIGKLSEQAGNTNEIRILRRVRNAVLDDLDTAEVGQDYRHAIQFSKDLNEKFTKGNIGKVLGYQRGSATSETMTLDNIIGGGGQEAKEAVEQILDSTPGASENIQNLIRTRFASATMNETTERINSKSGRSFLKKHDRLLQAFPDLKKELETATRKQRKVDDWARASDVTESSPLVREQAAAGVFLGADPGEEIKKVLDYGVSRGKTGKVLKDLVKETGKDSTGKAKKGLKNALVTNLMDYAKKGAQNMEDPVTAQRFISGRKFLERLGQLKEPIVESGLMSQKEVSRLEKIGTAFKSVETELTSGTQKKLITDAPGQLLSLAANWLGAGVGQRLATGGMGHGILMAGKGSSFMERMATKLTKDEARALLIKAPQDEEIMKTLLKDAKRMNEKQQMDALEHLKAAAGDLVKKKKPKAGTQYPAGAVVPPLVTSAEGEDSETSRLQQKINKLGR